MASVPLLVNNPVADECIEQLIVYGHDYDAAHVIIRFRLPAWPERVLDCIRLFGAEVLPQFHTE